VPVESDVEYRRRLQFGGQQRPEIECQLRIFFLQAPKTEERFFLLSRYEYGIWLQRPVSVPPVHPVFLTPGTKEMLAFVMGYGLGFPEVRRKIKKHILLGFFAGAHDQKKGGQKNHNQERSYPCLSDRPGFATR
jgi:hypothetical protein